MDSVWFANRPPATHSEAFVEGAHADTVVAGAGLTGLATAVLLARAGQRVVVLEARHLGAVTTGHTTAKLSLLQGSTLSGILAHNSEDVLRAYVEGNREGQAWLVRFMEDRGVPYQQRTAWSYATTDKGGKSLRSELEASHKAGLDVQWTTETELPFEVQGALTLADQYQIHPLRVLDALLADFASHSGVLLEGTRLTDAKPDEPIAVTTDRGNMTADRLVLATGVPVLDRGGYFAKVVPQRSYVTTYRVPGAIPKGMYLGIDEPTRSLRTVTLDGEDLLMIGGNGHVTGRLPAGEEPVADLDEWTLQQFPGAERTHAWSAQDYRSVNRIPFVGLMPRGGQQIYVATGFNKWGMTNAVAAALNLSGQILGGSMPWAETLGRRITKPTGVLSALAPNAEVAVEMAKDWVGTELSALPDEPPAEGEGRVGRGAKGLPEAVSTVGGVTCRLSGVCPHLGGVVHWNDTEKSWDCPLHGSRFASDGSLLEGPSVKGLAPRERV